jgi:hypothetical protein
MAQTHYQLLSNCSDEQLRRICERRKLPLPQHWEEGADGRIRLLKTMAFHLEDNRHLTNALADLDSAHLRALKRLAEDGAQPADAFVPLLADLGLVLPVVGGWALAERIADALADFDESALNFQAEPQTRIDEAPLYGFSLALTSVLLRCMGGIRVLKGGLPAKKELGQLLSRNSLLPEGPWTRRSMCPSTPVEEFNSPTSRCG